MRRFWLYVGAGLCNMKNKEDKFQKGCSSVAKPTCCKQLGFIEEIFRAMNNRGISQVPC